MSEKTNPNELKVRQLGIEDKIYEAMKKPSFSVEALTRKLNADDIDITSQSIRKFIKNTQQAQRELIAKDMQMSQEIVKTAMDYNKALKSILKEVEQIKNDAKDEKDLMTVNQMIGRLYQGMELLAKLTGDIKPTGSIDINIIYNQINEDIDDKMKGIRKEMFDKIETIDVDYEIIEEDKQVAKKIQAGEEN